MSFSVLRPLYPQRAMSNDNTVVTSTSFTVTTVAVSSQTFSAYPVGRTQLVSFDVQTADVYVRWDGTDPVASAGGGHVLPAGSAYTWDVAQYNAARWIGTTTVNIFASPFSAG